MEQQQSGRKTYKFQLNPTPDQDRALESVLWRCRALYNTALEQRKTWWERGQCGGQGKAPRTTNKPRSCQT